MTAIGYIIDKESSEVNGALCIKLLEVEKRNFVFEPVSQKKPITRQFLSKLADASDRASLELLLKEEQNFLKKEGRIADSSHSFHQVRIPFHQSFQIFKLLAATGRLYFNQKSIVTDIFSKIPLSLHFDTETHESIAITGKLTTPQGEIDCSQCDWICPGQPHWFIKGISLKFISTDIPAKYLKKAHEPSTWILPLNEMDELLKACTDVDDGEPPRIVYSEKAKQLLARGPEPLPILMLKDRSGAFADIWFDYGNTRVPFHNTHGQLHKCKRNQASENRLEQDLLETDFIRKSVGTTHYYCPLDKTGKSLTFLLEVGWTIFDSRGNQVKRHSEIKLAFEDKQNQILAKGKIKYDEYEANLGDAIGTFNRRERFIQLSPGISGLIPDRWENPSLDSLSMDGEIVSDGIAIKKHHFGVLESIWSDSSPTHTLDETLQQFKDRLHECKNRPETKIGAAFKGTLREYQQIGLNWLSFLYDFGFHGLLADDMGLGKTVQVIAFLSQLKRESPILIVVPTSLIFNWRNEIHKFLSEDSYMHHGSMRLNTLDELQKHSIILTTYATLRQDLPLLSQLSYQCLILDEAQVIKNTQTQTAQAVRSLRARFRLSITGTPIENHLGELWSHFNFLIPGLLGSEESFSADSQAVSLDSRYLEKIRRKIKPFILRRTKKEVAKDLPECVDQVIYIEMLPEQRRYYEDFLAGVKSGLLKKVKSDGISKHRMEVLESILRLRQICCHPLLFSSMNQEEILQSAKMEALLQDLTTVKEDGKKALVYSQFTSMLQLLSKAFKDMGWKHAYLDGSTMNRESVVKQFQEDPETSLFLISLKAGGVGLNLTAADYVFIFDPWWNDAVENQAINRAHRIGRNESVFAKRYVCIESIEEKMLRLKLTKRSLVEGLLENELDRLNLSEEDFLYLLS